MITARRYRLRFCATRRHYGADSGHAAGRQSRGGCVAGCLLCGHRQSQQLFDLLLLGCGSLEFAGGIERAERGLAPFFALDVPAEFDVIGQDQVGKVLAISLELFGLMSIREGDVGVFCFNVADGQVALSSHHHEVWRAAVGAVLGLIGSLDALGQRLDEFCRAGRWVCSVAFASSMMRLTQRDGTLHLR